MSPNAAKRNFELISTVPFWTRTVRTGRPNMPLDPEDNAHVYLCAFLDKRNQVALGFTTIVPPSNGLHRANGYLVSEEDSPTVLADGRSQAKLNRIVGQLRDLLTIVTPAENGTYADEDVEATRVMQIQVMHTCRQDADLLYDFLDQHEFTNGAFLDVEPETDGSHTFSVIHNNEEDCEICPDDLEQHFWDYSRMLMRVPVEFYRVLLVNLLEAWNFNRN